MYARALARRAVPGRGPQRWCPSRQSSARPGRPASAAERRGKLLTAGALFVFTGGVYYTAMGKMRDTDELGDLEAMAKVNVHESGLKVTRPRSVHDALQPRKED